MDARVHPRGCLLGEGPVVHGVFAPVGLDELDDGLVGLAQGVLWFGGIGYWDYMWL